MVKQLMRLAHVQEIWSSNRRPAKSYTTLQTVPTASSMQVVVLSWCYDVEMGTTNSLHASP